MIHSTRAQTNFDLKIWMRIEKFQELTSNRYGLPERKGGRDKIRDAKLVSNPGCYATGAQIALMPLADMGVLKTAQVFGVSGYSGAGTNPSDKNDLKVLTDNIVPYVVCVCSRTHTFHIL